MNFYQPTFKWGLFNSTSIQTTFLNYKKISFSYNQSKDPFLTNHAVIFKRFKIKISYINKLTKYQIRIPFFSHDCWAWTWKVN